MKKILLLISNGSEILEIAPFIDVFGWYNIIFKKYGEIKVVTASFTDDLSSKISFSGMKIIPEIDLNKEKINVEDYYAIVIPGGFGKYGYFDDFLREEVKELIFKFVQRKKLILGICTGAIALGSIGTLNNKKATTYLSENKRYFNQLNKYGANGVLEEIVEDDNIITSSNPKSAINLAFLLLEKLTSADNRKIIEKEMGYKIKDEI
ncbi:DJ-1/PfpI family protein [Fusobacterium sp. IOR10]|uniref:DJ-1/PfpI family protein n=1 Tax=Fusobacterium sp. IOR10 TaxID=2665157 RepID=UPI0013D70547|nr:DJ-1/PfpI family protein [Fusobacterium sp. IOR10]